MRALVLVEQAGPGLAQLTRFEGREPSHRCVAVGHQPTLGMVEAFRVAPHDAFRVVA